MQKLSSAIMIIAGTSIGIGMITLPAVLSAAGLFYGSICTITVWAIMWGAALAFAELSWHMPIGTNMLNMSGRTLGKIGKIIMCTTYLLLLYALSSAYLSSLNAISEYFMPAAKPWALYFWVAVMAVLLYLKFSAFDLANKIMMLLMIVSFLGLIFGLSLSPQHSQNIVIFGDLSKGIHVLPLLITAFGYQIVVPSVHKTIGTNSEKPMKKAILIGSLIPLIIYLIWFSIMMQQLEPSAFSAMINSGQPVALLPEYLAKILAVFWVKPISMVLVCSAIGTSWLGVSLSILDFFKDSILKSYSLWCALVPPLLFVIFWPNGFLMALQYAGYLVAILLIILPAVMLYSYRRQNPNKKQFINAKLLLLVALSGVMILFL